MNAWVDGLAFGPYEKQIREDEKNGVLSAVAAAELVEKLRAMRAYARMQIALYILLIAKRVIPVSLPTGAGLVAANAVIELTAFVSSSTSPVLRAPGMVILRLMPGISSCIGNIAVLKAEPELYDVALRLCERIYGKMRLGFLIPIFVRPSMQALRWLYSLEWPA